MSDDPSALPAVHYSAIVKREAVTRCWLGETSAFEARYGATGNESLFRISCRTRRDLDAVLDELEDFGLILAQDIGVVDAIHGPLLECEGIIFTTDEPRPSWSVHSDHVTSRTTEWVILASRENSGALDCWTEIMAARWSGDGLELAVLANEVLGKVPSDWYDEDGELLAEHCDEHGELKLPDLLNGYRVVDYDGEYLVGAPLTCDGQTVLLTELSDDAICGALSSFGWPKPDLDQALVGLREMLKEPR